MFVECFKNNGIPYLRLVDGIRVVKDDGKVTIRKKIIKPKFYTKNYTYKKT